MARSTARKRALNTLYEADEKGQDFLSLLAERIEEPGAQTPLPDYAIEIVRGVADHRREIDYMLNEHSTGWKVRRMAVVDRNILRIAAWEIIFNDDVPDRVAIDEALGLAKTLSDGDSRRSSTACSARFAMTPKDARPFSTPKTTSPTHSRATTVKSLVTCRRSVACGSRNRRFRSVRGR